MASEKELINRIRNEARGLAAVVGAACFWYDRRVEELEYQHRQQIGAAEASQQQALGQAQSDYDNAAHNATQERERRLNIARFELARAQQQSLQTRIERRHELAAAAASVRRDALYMAIGWDDAAWGEWQSASGAPLVTRFGQLTLAAPADVATAPAEDSQEQVVTDPATAPSVASSAFNIVIRNASGAQPVISPPAEAAAALPGRDNMDGDEPTVAFSDVAFPALVPIIGGRSLLLEAAGAAKAAANQALQAVMLRLLATIPPGKLRFTMLDPVGLGQNVAPFMQLADHDDKLVTSRAWTEPQHIEQRLADLAEHMENVIQKYLRNQYQNIEEYNAKAGEVAEPYRVLAVANFPVNFTEAAARRLVSIAANGPRCGVYVVCTVDTAQPLPHGFNLADLERVATVIKDDGSGFVWQDDDFADLPLELDGPPPAELFDHIIKEVGMGAKSASRVEVPFARIALPQSRWWQEGSAAGISVPLGRSGATRWQMLELGSGTAQHVLIGGKTGSGKSTLLHVLITSLALKYSPDEVELYLVDFKKGVEFKDYAANRLPHARIIAIESEREFGLSVLQGLDAELKERGKRFREVGAQSIAEYRRNSGAKCPRILLIVDEFQEFFTEDDPIAQQATLLLDRLVRQGRAFGVHVLLGSQTLAGSYSLARSTIDQMAVRIALQCSEADARLIMSDDNPAARLLSRPGEAIYNAANGLVEGNNPFQIVWFADEQREDYLKSIAEFAAAQHYEPAQPQTIFEGNAPAEVDKNRLLAKLLVAPTWANPTAEAIAWLGEPIAIKDPTAARFKQQSSSNLLIVGQNDAAALGMSVTALVSLAAQLTPGGGEGQPGACFYLLDFSAGGTPASGTLFRLSQMLPHQVRVAGRRDLPELIAELAAEVDRRLQVADGSAYPIYLCVYGLHRARDLRPEEDSFSYSFSAEPAPPSPAKQFATILREGPELGVHSIVWCDTLTNLNRTLDRRVLREFDTRVVFQMTAEDSSNLVDSPTASKLGQHRALCYSEELGQLEKFRPYGPPTEQWLTEVAARLQLVPSAEC